MILAPSILSADFGDLLSDIKRTQAAGAEYLHIDVMDGHFVPNISFGAVVMKSLKGKHSMVNDVHLMIENPDLYIKDFVDAGADIITIHAEASRHLHRTITLIKSYGVKAGVSLNPATSLTVLEEILPYIDMVLIMSVNPGFGGQSFIQSSLDKISRLRAMILERGLDIKIEVDGGVTTSNIKSLVDAGADILVAGSSIFGKPSIEEAIYDLKSAAK